MLRYCYKLACTELTSISSNRRKSIRGRLGIHGSRGENGTGKTRAVSIKESMRFLRTTRVIRLETVNMNTHAWQCNGTTWLAMIGIEGMMLLRMTQSRTKKRRRRRRAFWKSSRGGDHDRHRSVDVKRASAGRITQRPLPGTEDVCATNPRRSGRGARRGSGLLRGVTVPLATTTESCAMMGQMMGKCNTR